MAVTYSGLLRLAIQGVGDNPDTWGLVLNDGVFEMLEDAIAGMVSVSVASGDATLTTANGATDQARNMIVQITGAPGTTRNVIVPALTKVYLANNKTTGGFAITIKTASGSGVSLTANKPTWVYCDGTNVLGAQHAATADLATDANTLGTFAAALYARMAVSNQWTAAQSVTPVTLTDGANIGVNLALSNKFRLVIGGNRTLNNPTNAMTGQDWTILCFQDGTGSRTLSYGTAYEWQGGVAPTLTTTAGRLDILTFSYDITNNRHYGSIIQNYTPT